MKKIIIVVSLIYFLWFLVEYILEALGVGIAETRQFWQYFSLASLIVQGIFMLILRLILLHLPISDKVRMILFIGLVILFVLFLYSFLFLAAWGI